MSRQVVAVAVVRGRQINLTIHPRYRHGALELARTIAAARARRVARERQASGEQR